MIVIILLFIIVIAGLAFAISRLAHTLNEPMHQAENMHFDLLDDNGDPITTVPSDSVAGNPNTPVQHLRYFCIKDKGYHASVWPKDYDQFDIVEFNIAGMSYRENIDDYLGEFKGNLEAEPTNDYDPNAIKVLAPDSHHVGYVPKDMTSEVRNATRLPCSCFCYIGNSNGVYFSDCYILRK